MEILRDQYLDYMTYQAVERPLFAELFGPLVGLEEEWRAQGATQDEIEMTIFGFDYVQKIDVQCNTGLIDKPQILFGDSLEETLEENDEFIIQRDAYGRRIKLFKAVATVPLPLEYPVNDMDSWLKMKPRYEFSQDRLFPGWSEMAKNARAEGSLIVAHIPGGFDEARQLMGEEELCLGYYNQPELIHDIMNTIGETAERVLDIVSKEVTIDLLSVHEDLAGKSGPLVGPSQIEEFIKPYYRRIWDMLCARGTKIFMQDSDGNINPVISAFLDAGINCFYPMEPAAGMDIVEIRNIYGQKFSMLGGIDKHVLRKSKEDITKELEYKLQPKMREGGLVFGLDHRIPNGTPLENYRYYVKKAREILGLEPNPKPSWGRMAF